MSFTKFFLCSSVGLLFLACGGGSDPSKLFSIQLDGKKKEFQNNEVVGVQINNKKGAEIKSVTYSIDDEVIDLDNDKIRFDVVKLGLFTIPSITWSEWKLDELR